MRFCLVWLGVLVFCLLTWFAAMLVFGSILISLGWLT